MARPIPRAAPVTTADLPFNADPRPGVTGPALFSGLGSGTASPFKTGGAVSVRVCAFAAWPVTVAATRAEEHFPARNLVLFHANLRRLANLRSIHRRNVRFPTLLG